MRPRAPFETRSGAYVAHRRRPGVVVALVVLDAERLETNLSVTRPPGGSKSAETKGIRRRYQCRTVVAVWRTRRWA